MAEAITKNWQGKDVTKEQQNPVPPLSKYRAIRDFPGEASHDLPFRTGEIITVLEPCNVVFWYLGENSQGRRGVIPINFLEPCDRKKIREEKLRHRALPPLPGMGEKTPPSRPPKRVQPLLPTKSPRSSKPPKITVPTPQQPSHTILASQAPSLFTPATSYTDIDNRPPAPLPPEALPKPPPQPKYSTHAMFMRNSGWFSPNLETVICKKLGNANLAAIADSAGVYYFSHREYPNKRYTKKSKKAFHEIAEMFHHLYDKPHKELSPLEFELKYNIPDAKGWVIRLFTVSDSESIHFMEVWQIVMHHSLQPEGLNQKLTFTSKEQFYEFAEKFANECRERKK